MEEGVGFIDMVKLCGKRWLFHERTSSDREGCCSSWCEFVRVVDVDTGTVNYLN